MSKKELGKVATALFKAKHRIEKEENWCQTHYKVPKDGTLGFRWCSIGSIRENLCMWSVLSGTMIKYLAKAAMELDPRLRPTNIHEEPEVPEYADAFNTVYAFNDLKSHTEVMKMWDRAIEMAIGDGA